MRRLRGRIILLATWMFAYFNLERVLGPADTSGDTGLFMMGMMILFLVAPRLSRFPHLAILMAPLTVFYLYRIWIRPPEEGITILWLVFETGGLLITTLLSYWVSLAISEFELAVAHMSGGQRDHLVEDASLGSMTLYREVRRSRNHQRPLALLAVAIDETSLHINIDRIVRETQQSMIKQYALSAVARLLCDRLEDCDTVVQYDEHFLVLLPETGPDDLPCVIERLRRQSVEQIGVGLNIGAASLPEDSYTLEGLINRATQGIKTGLNPEIITDLKQGSEKQRASWSWLSTHIGTRDGSGPD